MRAGAIPHVFRGVGHFCRNIEYRIARIWTASLRDRCFEFAYGNVGCINVFAHRLEQAGKVECRAIRGRGVGAGVLVPKPLVEQQITVDKHGDAVGVGAIRRIA